ncbi:hypothetical protein HKD37_09G025109 [Glycine soja]
MMRIMKLGKYRLKAQVEKDEGLSGEGQSPRVEKDEGPSNPCGVYPDLSSFTRSGVIQTSVACIKRSAPNQVHIILSHFFKASSTYKHSFSSVCCLSKQIDFFT